MSIAIEAMFDSSDIERAVMIFDNDDVLFTDILDFMDDHKSDEYISLSVDMYGAKNSTMRLDRIIDNISDNQVKNKFSSVSNGIDFAVIDI